jgi:hypothetical protein
MPQDKKRSAKARKAAKSSIMLRTSAQGQKNRLLKGIANKLADKQLEKAMKLNKQTREISRKSRKK